MRFELSKWVDALFNFPLTLEEIMANTQQLNDKIAALQSSLDAEQQQVRDAIDALTLQIEELRNNNVPQESIDAIQAVIDDLSGTIADAPPTEPPTEPSEPV